MSRINIYFSKDFEDVEEYLNTKNNKSLYIANLIRKDMNKDNNVNLEDIEFIKQNISNILNILENSDGISFNKAVEIVSNQHDEDEVSMEIPMDVDESDLGLLDEFDDDFE